MEYIKLLRKYFKQFRDYRTREKELSRRILFAVTDEERKRYAGEMKEVGKIIQCGFGMIEEIENIKARRVIELHYADGKSWREISLRVNYSYGYCTHLEDNALKELAGKEKIRQILAENQKNLQFLKDSKK